MPKELIDFFNKKGINSLFIRNLIYGFVVSHIQLFGDAISFEEIIDRLNNNLDLIKLVEPNMGLDTIVGRYEGFDKNTISMYFTEENLNSAILREDFIKVFLHELTHSIYTIKQKDGSEKQIFGTYVKLADGKTPVVEGNFTYMEGIVNYIASEIYGKKNGIYPAQTINITKLMDMLDKNKLIRSAFDSDEAAFKKCFDGLPKGAYEYFTEGMNWFNTPGTYGYRTGSRVMMNFFQGIIPENVAVQHEFKTLDKKIKPINIEQVSFEHNGRYKR